MFSYRPTRGLRAAPHPSLVTSDVGPPRLDRQAAKTCMLRTVTTNVSLGAENVTTTNPQHPRTLTALARLVNRLGVVRLDLRPHRFRE